MNDTETQMAFPQGSGSTSRIAGIPGSAANSGEARDEEERAAISKIRAPHDDVRSGGAEDLGRGSIKAGGHPLTNREIVAISFAITIFRKIGVYFLIEDDEVVYVGQSIKIMSRIASHISIGRITCQRFAFIECERHELDKLETLYIKMLRPKYNIARKDKEIPEAAPVEEAAPPILESPADDDMLTREEAATFLTSIGCEISAGTLSNLAAHDNAGGGPPFKRILSRIVRYQRKKLRAWAAKKTKDIE